MFANDMDNVNLYLERIGYSGSKKPTVATLSNLQESHLLTIPYENFDILNNIPLSLEVPDIFDKIVVRSRGGYCFELNALFGWLLEKLGYQVTNYFARFWRDEPNPPPLRRHHVLQVEAEGKYYLCDVGVGGVVPCHPIQMVHDFVHKQGNEIYKLEKDSYFGWMLCEQKNEQWHPIYSFTEEPQLAKDYIMASYWCENAPESIFTKGAMVAIRTKEGRKSVAGREFRIFTNEGIQAFTPRTSEEYSEELRRHFGIVLD